MSVFPLQRTRWVRIPPSRRCQLPLTGRKAPPASASPPRGSLLLGTALPRVKSARPAGRGPAVGHREAVGCRAQEPAQHGLGAAHSRRFCPQALSPPAAAGSAWLGCALAEAPECVRPGRAVLWQGLKTGIWWLLGEP